MKDLKSFFTLILLVIGLTYSSTAQPAFTRVIEGDIVNTASDSRSVNFVDVNQDGWEDVFISNGPSSGQNNLLYLNDEGQGFTTVTDDPIVMDNGKSDGATFADVDNDGDLDAMVVTWHGQRNFFFRNNGDGSFTDETDAAPAMGGSYSETASWGDFDQDGFVDLLVTNSEGNFRNQLYQNEAGGTFSLVIGQQWLLQADFRAVCPGPTMTWTVTRTCLSPMKTMPKTTSCAMTVKGNLPRSQRVASYKAPAAQ